MQLFIGLTDDESAYGYTVVYLTVDFGPWRGIAFLSDELKKRYEASDRRSA